MPQHEQSCSGSGTRNREKGHNFKYVTLHRNPEILFQQHSFAMEAKFRLKFAFIDTHERIMQKSVLTQREL